MVYMYTFYEYLFFFFIYSFLGWCAEVCYCSVKSGKFVNRGFLNGPVCPIYGFGAVALIYFLSPVAGNIPLLFVASFLVTTLIEGFTGYALKKLFHTSWWDYSDMPFNIGGYVCLYFSLMWAVGGCIIMLFIQPFIAFFVSSFNHSLGVFLLWVFSTLASADTAVTVATVLKLNREMSNLDRLARQLRHSSDALAMRLGEHAIEQSEKSAAAARELKENYDRLKERFIGRRSLLRSRLIKAFPKMKHENFNDILQELKDRYNK